MLDATPPASRHKRAPESTGSEPLAVPTTGLAARHLGKRYRERPVLHDVSLSVQRGEAVGLLGPNGAGKTTCFLYPDRPYPRQYRHHPPGWRRHHQPAHVSPCPPRHRLSAPGSLHLPWSDGGAEYSCRAGSDRTQTRPARADAGGITSRVQRHASAARAGFGTFRRRAATGGKLPVPWPHGLISCCWTSRWPALTRSRSLISAIWCCIYAIVG
jgi:hypothetical protein